MVSEVDPSSSANLRANVQFACWRQNVDRATWPPLLARWLTGNVAAGEGGLRAALRFAETYLLGDLDLTHQQAELVARALHRDVQELMFENWPAAEPGLILQQNIRRLLENSGVETKAGLAKTLGVSAATLSRWISGSQVPDTRARRAIASLFGLRGVDDLEQTPVFLSYSPVTHAERVAWIQSRLVDMSWVELRELFPALRRLCDPRNSRR